MASIVVSDLVGNVRGSIGSVTVKGTRGCASIQTRSRGCVRGRKPGVGVSSAFSGASQAWSGLTAAARLAWKREAGGEGLGFPRFVSVMTRRKMWGIWYDYSVPIRMDLPNPGAVSIAISAGAVTFDVSWMPSPFPILYQAIMRFCVFPSPAARSAPGGWSVTISAADAYDGGIDLGAPFFDASGIFVPGRSVGVEVAFWCSRSGRLSGYIPARCIVAA